MFLLNKYLLNLNSIKNNIDIFLRATCGSLRTRQDYKILSINEDCGSFYYFGRS